VLVFASSAVWAMDKKELKYTWDLLEIYPSIDEWNTAREAVLNNLEKVEEKKALWLKAIDACTRLCV